MFNPDSNVPEPEFLKSLLEPLLDDFIYWFERSQLLLENNELSFLGKTQQDDLLQRVRQAHQEVETARMLLKVTEGKAGLDTAVLMPWHHLVTECWQVAMRFRTERPQSDS